MIEWLRSLAEKGGKGVVNNVDARSLGRAADEIEQLRAENIRVSCHCADLIQELINHGVSDERLKHIAAFGHEQTETPASRELLNITKGCLDSSEAECERLRAAGQTLVDEIRAHGTHQTWKLLASALEQPARPAEAECERLRAALEKWHCPDCGLDQQGSRFVCQGCDADFGTVIEAERINALGYTDKRKA